MRGGARTEGVPAPPATRLGHPGPFQGHPELKKDTIVDKTALVREAVKALIERESARRLALLGGTIPGFPFLLPTY